MLIFVKLSSVGAVASIGWWAYVTFLTPVSALDTFAGKVFDFKYLKPTGKDNILANIVI